jgi:parallel beta-helix repeat protein
MKTVSGVLLLLLLISTFALAFNIGLVYGQTTVYINSDGSISPSSAPISSVDNVTYTFTGNISYPTYDGIIIRRSNVVINGNGYAVHGDNSTNLGNGITLAGINNVTIKEVSSIQHFQFGICLNVSNNDIISRNNLAANSFGIYAAFSSNTNVTENTLANCVYGVYLFFSSNNTIFHNNFMNNTLQAFSFNSTNTWDKSYPSGGNFWSNYNGTDLYSGFYQNLNGSDGIGDTPYIIDDNNIDHYPIMNPYTISPDSNVTLNFPSGTNITYLSITEYTSITSPYPPLPREMGPIFNITVHTIPPGFTGLVRVGIHYDPGLVSNASELVIAQFDFLPGDINHDGKVDLVDLVLLANAYGTSPGNPRWNPNADLDGNNVVGLSDLVLLALHYGRTARWIDHPTIVDTINDFAYCTTDHFSGFGIH